LFDVLAMVAELEADLISARTREGMRDAKAKGLNRSGEHTSPDLARLFNVARSTVYRAMQRAGGRAADAPSETFSA
jgi:DNA invertase Pin-like site-specific DNA recombinase